MAPTALLLQWKAELELHTDGEQLRVLVYHGAAKKKHTTKKSLQKYDVVVTTYATVAMEKPSYDELNKKRKKKDDFVTSDSEYDSEEKAKKDGPLISFPWYRVRPQLGAPPFRWNFINGISLSDCSGRSPNYVSQPMFPAHVADEPRPSYSRNHRTRASQVTRELHAEYRWVCVTSISRCAASNTIFSPVPHVRSMSV